MRLTPLQRLRCAVMWEIVAAELLTVRQQRAALLSQLTSDSRSAGSGGYGGGGGGAGVGTSLQGAVMESRPATCEAMPVLAREQDNLLLPPWPQCPRAAGNDVPSSDHGDTVLDLMFPALRETAAAAPYIPQQPARTSRGDPAPQADRSAAHPGSTNRPGVAPALGPAQDTLVSMGISDDARLAGGNARQAEGQGRGLDTVALVSAFQLASGGRHDSERWAGSSSSAPLPTSHGAAGCSSQLRYNRSHEKRLEEAALLEQLHATLAKEQ
jgi:hypothetical protein